MQPSGTMGPEAGPIRKLPGVVSLEVLLRNCKGLKDVGTMGKQDPYCVLTCYQLKFRSNTHTDGGKDPVWNQIFMFEPVSPDIHLKLEVFDEKMLFRDKAIGEGKLPLRKVFESGGQPMDWQVPLYTTHGKQRGECYLTLTLKGLAEAKISKLTAAEVEKAVSSVSAPDPPEPPSPRPVPRPAPTGPAVPASPFRQDPAGVKAVVKAFPERPNLKKPLLSAPSGHVPTKFIFPQFAGNCWAEYDRGALLGRGNFGKTYLAIHRISRKEFAVKVIPKRRLSTLEEIQDVKNEVDVLKHLEGHPNVVCLEKVYEDRDDVCLVMELMRGGALLDVITKKGQYTEKDAAALARDIVSVVAKCHAESVIHRDIKPENFLLTDNTPQAKLKAADFGLSTFFKEGETFIDNVGSLFFTAPEVLRRNYGKEADIWSCGVILYMLLSGSIPFGANGKNESEVINSIYEDLLDLESEPWDKISEPAKDCIRRMLKRDPKHRAKAEQILNNDWLRENGCASDNVIEVGVITRMKNFNQGNKLKKLVTHMIVSKLPLHEINGLRKIFSSMDTSKSGRITMKEFHDALKQQGAKLPDNELRLIWKEVDFNGDGTMVYEEFLAATINQFKVQREDVMKKAFMDLDLNHDGFITRDEIKKGLQTAGVELSANDLQDIMGQVDQDGNGAIDYNEFVTMMRAL